MTSSKRLLTSGVPRMTPQSISICHGSPFCFGNVIRKQSPNPCRYMRTDALPAAGADDARPVDPTAVFADRAEPIRPLGRAVDVFAAGAGVPVRAISCPPSGSMQHGKGLIGGVFAVWAAGSHCRYVILQCVLCTVGARNRDCDAVADGRNIFAAIQY